MKAFIKIIFYVYLSSAIFCNALLAQSTAQKITANADSTSINNILIEAAASFYKNNAQSLQLAKNALELSKKIDYTKGIAKSYYAIGNIYNITAKFDTAKQAYENALAQAEKIDYATMQ
jgi:tetratricopeptide (TPR) repeat protein